MNDKATIKFNLEFKLELSEHVILLNNDQVNEIIFNELKEKIKNMTDSEIMNEVNSKMAKARNDVLTSKIKISRSKKINQINQISEQKELKKLND